MKSVILSSFLPSEVLPRHGRGLFLLALVVLFSCAMILVTPVRADDRIVDLGVDTLTDGAFDILPNVDLTFEVVTAPSAEWDIGPMPASLGTLPGGAWMRFRVKNSSNLQDRFILVLTESNLPFVEFYHTDPAGNLVSEQHYSGFGEFRDRNVVYRLPAFEMTLPKGQEGIVYARLANTFGGMFAQFKISPPEDFMIFQFHEALLYGGFYGMLALFGGMSMIGYMAIRQKVFCSYAALTAASIMTTAVTSGHWIDFTPFRTSGFIFFLTSVGIYTFCVFTFTRHFIAMHEPPAWILKLLHGQAWFGGFFAVLAWIAPAQIVGNLVMIPLFFMLMVPFISWSLVIFSKKRLILFSIAWSIYVFGVVAQFVFGQIGIISNFMVLMYMATITAAIEMILLSANMGIRLLEIRKEADAIRSQHVAHLETFSDRLSAEVEEKTRQLAMARDQAEQEARTDSLTRLKNRRAFTHEGKQLLQQMLDNIGEVCTIMIDVDHFKRVNDTYGHDAGDDVLIAIADILQKAVRKFDVAARLGGEEFVILAHFDNLDGAIHLAERVRAEIEATPITLRDGQQISVTVSLGVHSAVSPKNLDQLLSRADKALYEAKKAGRNQYKVYQAA